METIVLNPANTRLVASHHYRSYVGIPKFEKRRVGHWCHLAARPLVWKRSGSPFSFSRWPCFSVRQVHLIALAPVAECS